MLKKTKGGNKEKNDSQRIPEASFSNLILMLATGVYASLGLVPDPLTKEMKKDFKIARSTIDLLDVLKEKTKGNLTKEEEGFFLNVISDLKMKFAQINKKEGK